jgi:putative PEP-CTERM system histidine kinase
LKFFGPSSNRVFILVVALFFGIGLCVVCLSGSMRRKAKVLIRKHFYPHRYDYRAQWLEMTDRLSAAADKTSLCSAVLQMYCHTFALEGGVLFLRQREQSDFIPVALYERTDAPEVILSHGALVNFLQEKRWVFNRLENLSALADSDDMKIVEQYKIQFAVPLFFNDQVDGFVLLGNQINAGEPIIYEDYDLMKALASQSSVALHNLHLLGQLVDSREMAAIGKVSTFVMHDLKNIVSNLALVVDNAKDHMDDREFQQDMVETLSNSVSRMKNLIDRLNKFEVAPQLALEPCELKKLVEETLHDSAVSGVEIDGDPVDLIIDRQEISSVILNLTLNAFEAMGEEGAVKIKTGVNGRAFLVVQDHGCGMTEEYINTKLFKPFETTKVKGFGIGVYQSRQIVEAHGGEMQVMSKPGEGTTFTVWLPVG